MIHWNVHFEKDGWLHWEWFLVESIRCKETDHYSWFKKYLGILISIEFPTCLEMAVCGNAEMVGELPAAWLNARKTTLKQYVVFYKGLCHFWSLSSPEWQSIIFPILHMRKPSLMNWLPQDHTMLSTSQFSPSDPPALWLCHFTTKPWSDMVQ